MTLVEVCGEKYFIDPKLKAKWDDIKGDKLIKQDQDRVFCVDGRERSGKSVFTIQQAAYIDPTIISDLSRICFSSEEFLSAIRNAKPGNVVIFDEAFRGLSSRAALSKTNKKIVQAMMEMGQKNLIVFIVLPSFFMLDLYVAMLRSNALFHIAQDKGSSKRYFKVYNYKKKARLYQHGVKKGWEYKLFTNFKGNFYNKYPGGKEFELLYRKKKAQALQTMEQEKEMSPQEDKYMEKFHLLIKATKEKYNLSEREMAKWLTASGLPMDRSNIGIIMRKYSENGERRGAKYNNITIPKDNDSTESEDWKDIRRKRRGGR